MPRWGSQPAVQWPPPCLLVPERGDPQCGPGGCQCSSFTIKLLPPPGPGVTLAEAILWAFSR